MHRSIRVRSLILGTIFVATALTGLPYAAQATDATSDMLVEAPGAALAARGLDVIDDYGSFATARLSAVDVAALAAEGIRASPLSHTLGRAGVPVERVPATLRASPTSLLYVVQFRGPIMPEWRAALDTNTLAVYDYLPDDSYLVKLTPLGVSALRAMPVVRLVEPYHPAWKLAPELPVSGASRVTALAFRDAPLAAVVAQIAATGAQPLEFTSAPLEHVIDAMATPAQAIAIARLDSVAWIEPAYDEGSLDNAQASAITESGATGSWPLDAHGVTGSSQLTSVCDTGANTDPGVIPGPSNQTVIKMTHEMHGDDTQPLLVYNAHMPGPIPIQLPLPHRKMDLYYSPFEEGLRRGDADDADGHGTHTAGTLAGDAPPYGVRNNNDGVAFAAKLLECDITTGASFNILNNYSNYWQPAYDRGARVNSNSWGSSHTSAYTEKARQHDAYVWAHRDFIIVRSMGNIPNAIRPEAVAKSAFSIGATLNGAGAEDLASFSGNGPTQDGRLKPNVIAPGDCLTSSYTGAANVYVCLSGTSMSTPTVSGAATLVRDYFAKGFYPSGIANGADAHNPSSALVRAILQISGREVAGDRGAVGFPNGIQGWGRVTLEDALYFNGDARKLSILSDEDASLATGSTFTASLAVAAGQPLRIMLAWSDYPAAAGANPALVNDLDLKVTDPNGAVVATGDHTNVEEAVYIASPVAGTYTITVTGTSVPAGPQSFALVATGGV